MRRVQKIEGTAFTKRKSTHDVAETPEEFWEVFQQMNNWAEDPWASHRDYVEAAREALALEVARKPAKYRFKPREETGWYLGRLVMLGRLVQNHIDRGQPSWAAHEAALFGETFSELQMKLAREELFLLGKRTLDERAAGGAATRKGSDEGRVDKVRHHLAKGDKLTEAYVNAARDLRCGVSTVRGAWAKRAKGADATD